MLTEGLTRQFVLIIATISPSGASPSPPCAMGVTSAVVQSYTRSLNWPFVHFLSARGSMSRSLSSGCSFCAGALKMKSCTFCSLNAGSGG